MTEFITVQHEDGSSEDLYLKHYPYQEPTRTLSCDMLESGTLYMKLEYFDDPDAISSLLEAHKEELAVCSRLVIDLRRNRGGQEEAFFPLLPCIWSGTTELTALLDGGYYTRFSENNCRRRSAWLSTLLKRSTDEEEQQLLKTMISEVNAQKGRGFVYEKDVDLAELNFRIEGTKKPEKVVVITDTDTAQAAEVFVSICRQSPKVTVIGRPTAGTMDYCNPVTMNLDNTFYLTYPMSKTSAAMRGKGVSGKGIPVNRYVAFTPKECTEDVLLKAALEI